MRRLLLVGVVASGLAALVSRTPDTDPAVPRAEDSTLLPPATAVVRTWAEADGRAFLVCPACPGCNCDGSVGWWRHMDGALLLVDVDDTGVALCANDNQVMQLSWSGDLCESSALDGWAVVAGAAASPDGRIVVPLEARDGTVSGSRRYRRAARAQWRSATQDPDLTVGARGVLLYSAGESLVLSWVTD